MDNQIQTLIEMGFSHDQAAQALASSGNDLTKAIGYLFGEADDKGAGTQASPYIVDTVPVESYDSVQVSNPQDLPEFLSHYSAEASGTVLPPSLPLRYHEYDEVKRSKQEVPRNKQPQRAQYERFEVKNVSDSGSDVGGRRVNNSDFKAKYNPGYNSSHSTSQVDYSAYNTCSESFDSTRFGQTISEHAHERPVGDYSSDSDSDDMGASGDIGNIGATRKFQDSDDSRSEDMDSAQANIKSGQLFPTVVVSGMRAQLWVPLLSILARFEPFAAAVLGNENPSPFVAQVQSIVDFIRNFRRSEHWYVSADKLVAMLPSDLADDYTDDEAVLSVFEHLISEQPNVRPLLESLVESVEENISKDLVVLEIDSDTRRNTLYRTLDELFWQKGFVKLGLIKYKKVAPLVTYQLVGDAATYSVVFELQETIYPEVYSDKALLAVEREVGRLKHAETALHAATRKLMDLNFFEGKKIGGFLRQAAQALGKAAGNGNSRDPGAGSQSVDLIGISEGESATHTGASGSGSQSSASSSAAAASADLELLIGQIDAERSSQIDAQARLRRLAAGESLESYDSIAAECHLAPYDLLGVIFSESRYYVRFDSDAYVRWDGTVADFEDVQVDVALETRRGSHLVTLVYGERSGCPTGESDSESDEDEREKNESESVKEMASENEDCDLVDIDDGENGVGEITGESGENGHSESEIAASQHIEKAGSEY